MNSQAVTNKGSEPQAQPAQVEPKAESKTDLASQEDAAKPDEKTSTPAKADPTPKTETATPEQKAPANPKKKETDRCPRCGATGFLGECQLCSLGIMF
ncbi:hypothetical protein SBOR_3778 [Sclerotinia borealis F-4128]|uniref:Uncharacterized protein n=1 Tax=Sclerotinia borealis (strain F-4128) TaxID=1432307 RepID=W9CJ24_SCLBF|nr:hypothetical protein SBOR_3778 [Sclerotinia borealis F-4128]